MIIVFFSFTWRTFYFNTEVASLSVTLHKDQDSFFTSGDDLNLSV